ncbi:cell division protein FtsA [Patescibacteria group bacterium]|nr:cell division protein FtsA [Patescibacteria group bacterium]
MKEHLLVGLDLGTSHIRIAVGQLLQSPEKRTSLQIIGASEAPSRGIAKGAITSLDDVVSSISTCLEQAERMIGLPLSEAVVGIGGTSITTQNAKGVIGVSRSDGDIRPEDVARALEAARAYINPANQEILHVLPRSFMVDGQHGIKDPIGMQGIRLEVDVQIVQGLSSHVRNVTKAVFRTGLDISQLVYAPLAVAEAISTSRERELGVCLLSIGGATTAMSVYEDGELVEAITLPIGADHITSDIAIGLRISLDAAEQIKCMYGTASTEHLPKRGEEIDLKDFGAEQSELVPLRFVADIIEARVEEIFEKVQLELRKIDREGMLPAGVLLSGGGSKLAGMVDVGKRVLRLPCALGTVHVASSMPELIRDPSFSTAIGLVMWAYDAERKDDGVGHISMSAMAGKGGALLGKIGSPLKKIFKSFIP